MGCSHSVTESDTEHTWAHIKKGTAFISRFLLILLKNLKRLSCVYLICILRGILLKFGKIQFLQGK